MGSTSKRFAGGFTEIDLSAVKLVNQKLFWRGKPIFFLKKTAEMENSRRDLVIGSDRFTVAIGLCTHLGCIPNGKKTNGNVHVMVENLMQVENKLFGPPPRPLDLPPFSVKGTSIVLGEEGPEYKANRCCDDGIRSY